MDQRDDWSISNIFYKSEFPIHLQSPWLFFRNTAQFLEISDSLKKKKPLQCVPQIKGCRMFMWLVLGFRGNSVQISKKQKQTKKKKCVHKL